jgi:hypothetical protein
MRALRLLTAAQCPDFKWKHFLSALHWKSSMSSEHTLLKLLPAQWFSKKATGDRFLRRERDSTPSKKTKKRSEKESSW